MTKISYAGYRFPPVIIQQAIWLYARFTLSFRDVEELLAERGIDASYETVRRWFLKFMRQGKSGGGLCFGYEVVRKFDASGKAARGEGSINNGEAAIIRRIFDEFANG